MERWAEWTDEPTSWWLDGTNDELVLVYPGDRCLFEDTPHSGTILREVQSRGPLQ